MAQRLSWCIIMGVGVFFVLWVYTAYFPMNRSLRNIACKIAECVKEYDRICDTIIQEKRTLPIQSHCDNSAQLKCWPWSIFEIAEKNTLSLELLDSRLSKQNTVVIMTGSLLSLVVAAQSIHRLYGITQFVIQQKTTSLYEGKAVIIKLPIKENPSTCNKLKG